MPATVWGSGTGIGESKGGDLGLWKMGKCGPKGSVALQFCNSLSQVWGGSFLVCVSVPAHPRICQPSLGSLCSKVTWRHCCPVWGGQGRWAPEPLFNLLPRSFCVALGRRAPGVQVLPCGSEGSARWHKAQREASSQPLPLPVAPSLWACGVA